MSMDKVEVITGQSWQPVIIYPTVYKRRVYKLLAHITIIKRYLISRGLIYVDYNTPIMTNVVEFDIAPENGERVVIRSERQ